MPKLKLPDIDKAVAIDWPADFAKLEIRDAIRPKVLKANAHKILGI